MSSFAATTRWLARIVRGPDCRNCFGEFRGLGPRSGFDSSSNVPDSSSRSGFRTKETAFAGMVADRRMALTYNTFLAGYGECFKKLDVFTCKENYFHY